MVSPQSTAAPGRALRRTRYDALPELTRMKEHHAQGSGGGRLRAVVIGALATSVTYVVGRTIGVAVT